MDIEDVIQANIKACSSKKNGVYNVGTGNSRSFQDIADILQKELGTNLGTDYIPNPHIGYQTHTQANINSTQDNLGFTPRKHFLFSFKKSLAESGFLMQKNIHHDFSLLPAPFSTLTNKFLGKIDHKLDFLGKTPLKVFSSSNLICAQKNES